jgi:hypothetical protein
MNGSKLTKILWGAGDYPVILNGIEERLFKRQDFLILMYNCWIIDRPCRLVM